MNFIRSLEKKWMIYGRGGWNAVFQRREVHNRRLLILQLDTLGDSATFLPSVSILLDCGYKVDLICRKELQTLWNEFLPAIQTIPVDMPKDYNIPVKEMAQYLSKRSYEAVFIPGRGKKFGGFLGLLPLCKSSFGCR